MEELDDEDGSQEDSQEEDAGTQDESQDSQDERVRSVGPPSELDLSLQRMFCFSPRRRKMRRRRRSRRVPDPEITRHGGGELAKLIEMS